MVPEPLQSPTLVVPRSQGRILRWYFLAVIAALVLGSFFAFRLEQPTGMTLDFAIAGPASCDVDFSPDGTLIAVSGAIPKSERSDGNYILDVRSRRVVHLLPDDAWNAAWSPDGSRLAVATSAPHLVEYRFDHGFLPFGKPDVGRGGAGSLSYDRAGDLFACTDFAAVERFARSQAFVWWNDGTGLRDEHQELTPLAAGSVVFASVANLGVRIRLAVAHEEPEGVAVFSFPADRREDFEFVEEFSFPEERNCWVALSPSGERLAILSAAGLRLIDLREGMATLIHSQPDAARGEFACQRQPLSISGDGSRVACVFKDRVEVRRVADGTFVASAPGAFWSVAISTDGTRLAATDVKERALCVFRIP